uniref:Fibronectin type III and SPRY domain containing 2 n=1 Tax=Astatotilapia calliptera TaxID=8154 RepID=A0A3P8QHK5_ASTCA
MDLYEIRGGRLGVIAEEAELQELSRESTAMETYNVGSPPSPTAAEDGSDGEEDAFKEGETEGEIILIRDQLQEKVAEMESFAGHLEEIFLTVEENFGRQEQHLEQHYNDVLQTLSQRQDESAARLEEEKKSKLEALYGQLLACGQALDASKELIETAQEVYRSQDKRLLLKNRGVCQRRG